MIDFKKMEHCLDNGWGFSVFTGDGVIYKCEASNEQGMITRYVTSDDADVEKAIQDVMEGI